jgi:hypothetical protein
MPFPVSDITANYVPGGPANRDDESGYVLITGGCNSTRGNERINGTDPDTGAPVDLFACLDTSSAALKFDPFAGTFTALADMPHPRQRHAAAFVNGELHLLGGRDSGDNLVTAIDVRVCCSSMCVRACVCACT